MIRREKNSLSMISSKLWSVFRLVIYLFTFAFRKKKLGKLMLKFQLKINFFAKKDSVKGRDLFGQMEKVEMLINFMKEFLVDTNFRDISPRIFKILNEFATEVRDFRVLMKTNLTRLLPMLSTSFGVSFSQYRHSISCSQT